MLKVLFISGLFAATIYCSAGETLFSGNNKGKPVQEDAKTMFTNKILPVIQTKCAPCHVPDKGGFKAPLDNFDDASKLIDECLIRVQLPVDDPKYMPFKNKRPALADSELVAFKAWRELVVKNKFKL